MGAAHPRLWARAPAEATLDVVEDRDARAVEITLALLLGVAVAVLPRVALWLVGRMWGLSGPGWIAAKDTVQLVALLAGAAVTVGWLVRSRV